VGKAKPLLAELGRRSQQKQPPFEGGKKKGFRNREMKREWGRKEANLERKRPVRGDQNPTPLKGGQREKYTGRKQG